MAAGNPSLTSAYVHRVAAVTTSRRLAHYGGPVCRTNGWQAGGGAHVRAAVILADHEPLQVMGAVVVVPAGGAVARCRARHRQDLGVPARVQGTRAGREGEPGWVAVAVPTGIESVTRREMS